MKLSVFLLASIAFVLNLCGAAAPATEESLPAGIDLPAQTLPSLPQSGSAASVQCSDAEPPLVTDLNVRQPPVMSEPAPRAAFRDPVFGRCLVRVTARSRDKSEPGGLKNEYSRVQAFNADETRILVMSTQGGWYLYDAQTLQPLGSLPLGIDPRWSATDPNLIYYSEETRLMSYNIATQQTAVVHEFANDFPGQNLAAVWGRYEGSPSRDGRWWGLMAENQNWLTNALLVYDLQTNRVTATLDTRGWPADAREIDSVTISPLGNYFLVYMDLYCARGQLGTPANPCGLMVYDRNLQNGRGLLRIIGHSDTALDAQGREVLVYQDIDTDYISMLDLATGAITPLWPIDFTYTNLGLHISGRAFNRPGWAVVSTHDGDTASHTWMDDSVFLIELVPNGRVVRLAHTHSLVDESQGQDYWAEPQATANRDLTRVLFTTNWGRSGTEQVEMYQIYVPPVAFAATTTDTFCSQANYDGWILETSEFGNVGGTMNSASTVFLLGDDRSNRQYRAILSFDTASLPDNAVIFRLALRINQQGLVGRNPFLTHGRVIVDIRKGFFSTFRDLQPNDFQAAASRNNIGFISNDPQSGGWYSASLNSAAFAYVNLSGLTQFRLRFALDDDNDRRADYLTFYSGNATADLCPQLIVEHSTP